MAQGRWSDVAAPWGYRIGVPWMASHLSPHSLDAAAAVYTPFHQPHARLLPAGFDVRRAGRGVLRLGESGILDGSCSFDVAAVRGHDGYTCQSFFTLRMSLGQIREVGLCPIDATLPLSTLAIMLTVFGTGPLMLFETHERQASRWSRRSRYSMV